MKHTRAHVHTYTVKMQSGEKIYLLWSVLTKTKKKRKKEKKEKIRILRDRDEKSVPGW